MPAQFNYALLSGSTSGRPIPVVQTATPGTLIHTADAGSATFDEIYLFATNVTANSVALTVEWGGVTTGDHIAHLYIIPGNSARVVVVSGQPLNGGLIVRAFAATASALNVSGFVYKIS
ncbi:MAG: hypothetical protein JWL61_5008 [Gemmatimonadetes bacterium]|nr:hypothetical protein [Gemmatimonadota bacterium]